VEVEVDEERLRFAYRVNGETFCWVPKLLDASARYRTKPPQRWAYARRLKSTISTMRGRSRRIRSAR
jgi:hypothetical protein